MAKEIERKWLLSAIPEEIIAKGLHSKIEQVYLSTKPEVRLRKRTKLYPSETPVDYRLTVKSSGTLERSEFEVYVDEDVWDEGFLSASGDPILKDYYILKDKDGYDIEVSIVDEHFIYAEVEFLSAEEAKNYPFPYPEVVIEDVTGKPEYKMKCYWERKTQRVLWLPTGKLTVSN